MRGTSPGHRRWAPALTAVIAVVVCMLASATSALAIPAPIHIANTGGEGVYIRPDPNTSRPAVGWMPEGASPDYNCFAWGQSIGGVPIWFNVNYNGVTGFYASYYDDSSYHSNEELTAKYGVPLCGSAPPSAPPGAPAPSPAGSRIYPIVNADGGIYYRDSPHWGDTRAQPGVGVYNGDQVELICGAFGDAVGPYGNTAWSYVRNLTRPSIGNGWVNEHYINDGVSAFQFVPGEPICGPEIPGAGSAGGGGSTGPVTSFPPGGSLYYSPYKSSDPDEGRAIIWHYGPRGIRTKWVSVPAPSTFTANYDEWHRNSGDNQCPDAGQSVPPRLAGGIGGGKTITTLAAWSDARSAPLLFLQASSWASQINYILLFDPGNTQQYRDGNCVGKYRDLYSKLASWLGEKKGNRLVVLAGNLTADYGHKINGRGHAGIQNWLFPPIHNYRSRNIRSQVVVCNYDDMGHEDLWKNFRSKMNDSPITLSTCPTATRGEKVVSWNP